MKSIGDLFLGRTASLELQIAPTSCAADLGVHTENDIDRLTVFAETSVHGPHGQFPIATAPL